jgi:hypothetical protein
MSQSSTADILQKKSLRRFGWTNPHCRWRLCTLALFLIGRISWVLLSSTWHECLWYGHFNVIKFVATLFYCSDVDDST